MIVKKFICNCLDQGIDELKQPENMNKIQNNIVDPLIIYTYKKLYPYF